jgi:hypothetical protein
MDTWLSIVGGGLAAALLTVAFNVYWDKKKQKLLEDWEFRRYHANQIHLATAGLTEAFFGARTELHFLFSTLETLTGALRQLTAQADSIVRLQDGPQLTVAELEQRKSQLLQPFQKFNQEQVTLRWNQHEQRAKELMARAETHLTALEPLVPKKIYEALGALYAKLSTRWVWDLPHAQERLRMYDEAIPELRRIRGELLRQIELKLGRP